MTTRVVLQDLLLAAVLVVAAYFTAAALVALPTLSETPENAETDLIEMKNELAVDERRLTPRLGRAFQEDPFAPIAARLSQRVSRRQLGAQVGKELNSARAMRDEARQEHDQAMGFWASRVAEAKGDVYATFAENVDRKGNAERRMHYARLLMWFDRQMAHARRELDECVAASELAERDSYRWSQAHLPLLGSSSGEPMSIPIRWADAREQCKQRWEFAALPARPEVSERFGYFKPIAAWLVHTESLSLVAIVGLFGLGLLGAAASSVIRERGSGRGPGQPLVSDLPSVIVRGMTAALVVFLAVKGGLAVFAAGMPEPNPYVLFLTCLIAAIFSEPVFEGAQSYLKKLTSRWGDQSAHGD